jgi:hypothetical protein
MFASNAPNYLFVPTTGRCLPPPPSVTIRSKPKYDEVVTIQELEALESRVQELENSLITNTFSRITGERIVPSDMSDSHRRLFLDYIKKGDKENIQAFVNICEDGNLEYYDIRFSAIENKHVFEWNSQYDEVGSNYSDEFYYEDEDEEARNERMLRAEAEAKAYSDGRKVDRISKNMFMLEKLGTCFLSPEWINALLYKGRTKDYEWNLVKYHYNMDPESFYDDDGTPISFDESEKPVYRNVLNLNGLFSGDGLERY